jgi:hypothetical protein
MDSSNVKVGDFILIDYNNINDIICIIIDIYGKELIVENIFDEKVETILVSKWSYLDYEKQMKLTEIIQKNPKYSKYKRTLRKQKIKDILKEED